MYMRNRETTIKMLDKHFSMFSKKTGDDEACFNGVVKVRDDAFPLRMNFAFSPNKKYHVVNGYILDDEGYGCGANMILEDELEYGFYEDFPAIPIKDFNTFESGMFEVIEKY